MKLRRCALDEPINLKTSGFRPEDKPSDSEMEEFLADMKSRAKAFGIEKMVQIQEARNGIKNAIDDLHEARSQAEYWRNEYYTSNYEPAEVLEPFNEHRFPWEKES